MWLTCAVATSFDLPHQTHVPQRRPNVLAHAQLTPGEYDPLYAIPWLGIPALGKWKIRAVGAAVALYIMRAKFGREQLTGCQRIRF